MKTKIGLLVIIVLAFQGCIIHSLHPLYTPEVLIENKHLEGFWTSEDASPNDDCPEGLFFEKHEGSDHYHMKLCDNGAWINFDVHLVKLGEHSYLDFYLNMDHTGKQDSCNLMNSFLMWYMVPVHSFARIKIDKDQFTLEDFDTEWLDDLFEKRKIRIKHEKVDGNVVLTASSKDLQKFVLKYSNEEKAFEKPVVYQKVVAK